MKYDALSNDKRTLLGIDRSSSANLRVYECQRKVLTIDARVFRKCYELKKLIAPNVERISESSFAYCTNLKEINIKNVITINKYSFLCCESLRIIDAPKLTYLHHSAFSGCINLETINIPNCVDISSDVFKDCTKLHTINSNLSKEQLTIAFGGNNQYNEYINRHIRYHRNIKLNKLLNGL